MAARQVVSEHKRGDECDVLSRSNNTRCPIWIPLRICMPAAAATPADPVRWPLARSGHYFAGAA
jgi:hypothetical protein